METNVANPGPAWWIAPGETDTFAWLALGFLVAILFLVVFLYAKFDQYTEHRGKNTPLKTTIPTMLVIGLAYELLPPLAHFSYLLPLALIIAALARDIMLWWSPEHTQVTEVPGRD
ncbi:hypothetical protein RDV64_03370 [Acuticoccus sp. MNP-M23]|uniref:hypothetical protein n=1 Tax=Acuticoccus sp. MNP-M23 TaxID=3072793 RepID=UPI002815B849|nr:hypothetical protein [Acuticoccus sp. MNP-M23]WMS43455.1 hypothetical protein RDV64_03370 [Acuticoccus sp. MNP-M23]